MHTIQPFYNTYTLLAAGFCERWPKACAWVCAGTKDVAKKIYNDTGSIRFLAKKYGIGKTQVGYIKQGKRWME